MGGGRKPRRKIPAAPSLLPRPDFPKIRDELAALAQAGGPNSHFAEMKNWIDAGGPEPEQYSDVHDWIRRTEALISAGSITREDILTFWRGMPADYLSDTMQGFGLTKPYGYAGDFEMIDRIYLKRITPNPKHARWDRFFHAQSAPRAVRNRKTFFLEIMANAINERGQTLTVLNLGCGPCRDVAEFVAAHPIDTPQIDCVDQDSRAIAHAKGILGCIQHNAEINFIEANAVRFRPTANYDFIWSAGLFDYLPDSLFIQLLRRLIRHVKANGQIIIGNFRDGQPSRAYMELVGDWMLFHRTPEQLQQLAHKAGANPERVSVTAEEERVNLFLVIHGKQ